MRTPGELWEALGDVEELELRQVLTRLFVSYEDLLKRDPDSPLASQFFKKLDLALAETDGCNLNRR